MSSYIIRVRNEEQGPYSFDDLQMYEQIGEINAMTPTRLEGRDVWKDWGRIKAERQEEKERMQKYEQILGGPLSGRKKSIKQRGIFIILGLLIGGIGAHNFYAGFYGRGVVQLILTILAFAIYPLAAVAVGAWILIELITVSDDSEGLKMA
jgi:hypothetical protein